MYFGYKKVRNFNLGINLDLLLQASRRSELKIFRSSSTGQILKKTFASNFVRRVCLNKAIRVCLAERLVKKESVHSEIYKVKNVLCGEIEITFGGKQCAIGFGSRQKF